MSSQHSLASEVALGVLHAFGLYKPPKPTNFVKLDYEQNDKGQWELVIRVPLWLMPRIPRF
jgi:hypothetical protein